MSERFRVPAAVFFIAFGWLSLFTWQGLDFTDMGYWYSGYQQFYSYPEDINSGLVNWLSYFIGNWWGQIFGQGVVVYRFGYVLVTSLTAAMAVYGLQRISQDKAALLAAALITLLYASKTADNWIGYNNLTGLFYTTGAVALFFALSDQRPVLCIVAAAILGMSVFIRFPNIMGIFLVFAIWLFALANRWHWQRWATWTGLYFFGFTTGISIIGLAICLHGHAEFYLDGLRTVAGMASNEQSHHSASGLTAQFVLDYTLAALLGGGLLLLSLLLTALLRGINRPVIIIAIAAFTFILLPALNIASSWRWAVTGFCHLLLLTSIVVNLRKVPEQSLMAFLAAGILVLAPLGSGNGILNSVFGIWLALPLAMVLLWRNKIIRIKPISNWERMQRLQVIFLLTPVFCLSALLSWNFTYRDTSNRTLMNSQIDHPFLRGVFTTPDRSRVVTELLDALEDYVKPGDYLLSYNEIPMVHYLTKTRPWLGKSWIMLVGPDEINNRINKRLRQNSALPVIVRAKGNTSVFEWPTQFAALDTSGREDESRVIFDRFTSAHHYRVDWSNSFFEILVPQYDRPEKPYTMSWLTNH